MKHEHAAEIRKRHELRAAIAEELARPLKETLPASGRRAIAVRVHRGLVAQSLFPRGAGGHTAGE